MKRILITLTAMVALAVALPLTATASSHHGKGHHKGTKPIRKATHIVRYGSLSASAQTGPSSSPQTGSVNSGTPTSGDATAGTIDSFQNGVLTIKLNDGSKVSGKVTSATEIECQSSRAASGDDDGDDDGPNGDHDDGQRPAGTGTTAHEADANEADDDAAANGAQSTPPPPCDSSALVAGTVVKEAELLIGPGAAAFHSVHLLRP